MHTSRPNLLECCLLGTTIIRNGIGRHRFHVTSMRHGRRGAVSRTGEGRPLWHFRNAPANNGLRLQVGVAGFQFLGANAVRLRDVVAGRPTVFGGARFDLQVGERIEGATATVFGRIPF